MTRTQQPAITLFAIGMVGLGVLALIYGDFALVWQPVAPWFPGRTALAYASGVIMLFGGLGLLFRRTASWSIRILFPYLIIWFLLKVPALVVAPQMEAVWLGAGELAVLLAGGWTLFAVLSGLRSGSALDFATHDKGVRIARMLFAISLIPIGLSHIFYVKETAALVPAWLPYREGWAYLTGAGQMACGLGVLLSILPQVAAFAEATMLSLFTILVWGPAIFHTPKQRLPWTAFFISWAITAAAWVVAGNIGKAFRRRTSDTSGLLLFGLVAEASGSRTKTPYVESVSYWFYWPKLGVKYSERHLSSTVSSTEKWLCARVCAY